MLSVGLVGTWVYHLYDKTQYSQRRTEVYIKDSIAVAQGVQDSLNKIYSLQLNDLGARLDSTRNTAGMLEGDLKNKLGEINRLKAEIAAILKQNNIKKEDLDIARRKSVELQMLVAELQSRNSTIEEEKKQISAVLDQVNTQVKGLEGNVQTLSQENKTLNEKVTLGSAFVVSELRFSPVTVKNHKEQETDQAKKASKFVVSFNVQNNIAEYEVADVYVAITQPNGTVLKNDDVWEPNTTLKDGNKVNYTRKVRIEYTKGESKPVIFSLNADEYMKGTYNLVVYHNGYPVGKASKTLN